MIEVKPVILCGGSGSRMWPLSRNGFPKQFISFSEKESLFQKTLQRIKIIQGKQFLVKEPTILAGEDHRFLVTEQLREIDINDAQILLEPLSRNTAPALTLAALEATSDGVHDPVLLVMPSDQSLSNIDEFGIIVEKAINLANKDQIIILGVKPDKAETGFGYIKVDSKDFSEFKLVHEFVEKPCVDLAKKYIREGCYSWNAGIFLIKASVWLKAIKTFKEEIFNSTLKSWLNRQIDGQFVRLLKNDFELIPCDSIDYSVIEPCVRINALPIKMISFDAGWNDLGSWDSVWNTSIKDESGNVCKGDVIIENSRNSLVYSDNRLVALLGVDNLVVIETPDAILVMDKNSSQDVKKIINILGEENRKEHISHRKVLRPWGWYDSVDEGNRFKVKRIVVNPGCSLSLQFHYHRAEHWIVVKGTAEVTCDNDKFLLTENQSTYIPLGCSHRLKNPGKTQLEIIEVQSGDYLCEDDIVRIDDIYGRVNINNYD